jgi:hypothetical protein
MSRVFIPLCQDEKEALARLAKIELRQPVDQARFIIRQALVERGLLQPDPAPILKGDAITALPVEDPKPNEGVNDATA